MVGTAKGKTDAFIAGAYDCVPRKGNSAAMCDWSYKQYGRVHNQLRSRQQLSPRVYQFRSQAYAMLSPMSA